MAESEFSGAKYAHVKTVSVNNFVISVNEIYDFFSFQDNYKFILFLKLSLPLKEYIILYEDVWKSDNTY